LVAFLEYSTTRIASLERMAMTTLMVKMVITTSEAAVAMTYFMVE
jgi:hypothetical protein